MTRLRDAPVIALPAPAPLPSLRDALQRRACVFGPYDLDEAPAAPRGVLARCAAVLRGVADVLEPARVAESALIALASIMRERAGR